MITFRSHDLLQPFKTFFLEIPLLLAVETLILVHQKNTLLMLTLQLHVTFTVWL
jgi:hypothetical protein